MNGPYPYQIPSLNMLLGAFDSWGVGKWATIQDVVVRCSIGIDRTEFQILANYLINDGYIKPSQKVVGYNLAQIPGEGMVDVPVHDEGYELTPKGKQFHLEGGYRLDKTPPRINPNTKQDNHINPVTSIALRVWRWIWNHKTWSLVIGVILAIAIAILSARIDKRWNGEWNTLWDSVI